MALDILKNIVLNKNKEGTTRLARNVDTGKFVAVKKLYNPKQAKHETEFYKENINLKQIIKLEGIAHIKKGSEAGLSKDKLYLFFEFTGLKTGNTIINETHSLIKFKKHEAQRKIKMYAQRYLQEIANLHEQGIYHRNIMPKNFIYTLDDEIKIDNFAIPYPKETTPLSASTTEYSPPEALEAHPFHEYTAEKHDAFSLGLCLLEIKNGVKNASNTNLTLTINNRTHFLTMRPHRNKPGKYYRGSNGV